MTRAPTTFVTLADNLTMSPTLRALPFFNSLIQILPSLFLGGQEKRVQRREMPWRSEYLQVCGVNPICAMNDTETKT